MPATPEQKAALEAWDRAVSKWRDIIIAEDARQVAGDYPVELRERAYRLASCLLPLPLVPPGAVAHGR